MKKTYITIGTLSFLGLLFLGTQAFAALTRDVQQEMQNEIKQSDEHFEKARILSCERLGQLTSRCFKGDRATCNALSSAEEAHFNMFQEDVKQGCFQSDEAPGTEYPPAGTPIPLYVAPESDPLLFGDEEQVMD